MPHHGYKARWKPAAAALLRYRAIVLDMYAIQPLRDVLVQRAHAIPTLQAQV